MSVGAADGRGADGRGRVGDRDRLGGLGLGPEEVGALAVALAGDGATHSVTFGQVTVDVPRESWARAVTAARDDPRLAADYFDWLSAVDETDTEPAGFSVVTHLYSLTHRHHLMLRTRVPADDPTVATLTGVFAGAEWHERETHEMFGVTFDGHPGLSPLLLPDGFEGHPLRKDFVLAARAAKEWPGAREPGESHTGARRARMRAPGVPDPSQWGPGAAGSSGGAGDG